MGHAAPGNSRRLVENVPAIELFVCGLARVEPLEGNNARFVFYVSQMVEDDGSTERNIVLRLIIPRDAIGAAIEKVMMTLGSEVLTTGTAGLHALHTLGTG